MAELKISGRMCVKRFKSDFKNAFGGTLRIYDGQNEADENATLASIRTNTGSKGGDFVCRGHRTVGRFERDMLNIFGIKVQIATPDDNILALDGITLANLKNIPPQATQEQMEAMVGYKRRHKNSETIEQADECEVVSEQVDENDYKVVRLKVCAEGCVEIAVQPLDEDAEQILEDYDMDAESAYCDIESYNDDCGLEKLNYYFVPSYSPARITAIEIDEDDQEGDELYDDDEYEISPNFGMMSMDDANENFEDDEESLEEYKEYLLGTKLEEEHRGCATIANSLKKAWNGLAESDVTENTFLPTAMAEAMRQVENDKAVIRGAYLDDELDISFYIRLPKDEEFDASKLNFVCMDPEYDDYSSLLQEYLTGDMTCLNMVIYDGVMYFAGESTTFVDGGYSDLGSSDFDIVDTEIESIC